MERINLEDPQWSRAVSVIMRQVDKVQKGRGAIDYEQLKRVMTEKVNEAVELFTAWHELPSEVRNESVRKIFTRDMCRKYVNDRGVTLIEGDSLVSSSNIPWVAKAVEEGKLSFNSYKYYATYVLPEKGISEENIRVLDKVTSSLLDGMGNPQKQGHTVGLLMGDVQAGKTQTYTGVCHKALDAGYRFLIVLTGTTDTLRVQTQNRLNADLVGQGPNSQGQQIITRGAPPLFDWNLITTPTTDFTVAKADSQIAVDNKKQVTLAVTKKNARVLEHLITWLENARGLGVQHLPLLLVDDEADNASVNSKKEEEDPSRINQQIRKILNFFDKTAYLAVTATPFANVFIHPQTNPVTNKMILGEKETMDLFPRDYIYVIPPPNGYLGVERLFGDQGEIEENPVKYSVLIPMRLEDETDMSTEAEARRVYEGKIRKPEDIKILPQSLVRAVLYFCCVCTLKDFETSTSNTSMLVHIARFTQVQNRLAEMIEEIIKQILDLSEGIPADAVEDLRGDTNWKTLESIWNEGCGDELWYDDTTRGKKPPTFRELSGGYKWIDIWKKRFGEAVRKIQVVLVNSDAKEKNMASYYERSSARLIAVGGDSLSRGVTLDGLCVSYFSRRSPAYDTLLQMGRWFGYRESMRSYMKIWISDCLIKSYSYIAEALGEFRETLEDMRRRNRQPSDFGLRIRCAPANAGLMVTAANKRRTAKRVKIWLNFAGKDFQAATFPLDPKERRENVRKIGEFLKSLGPWQKGETAFPGCSGRNDLVWKDVPSDKVAEIIRNLNVPDWSDNLDPNRAAERIKTRAEKWLVRVISLDKETAGRKTEDVFDLGLQGKVVCSGRTMRKLPCWIQQTSKGIRSSGHFMRHWSREKIDEVKRTIKTSPPEIYPRRVFAEPGEPPQLLIYPIRTIANDLKDRREHGEPFVSDEVMATIAFGLPCDERFADADPIQVTYDCNVIRQRQEAQGYDMEDE